MAITIPKTAEEHAEAKRLAKSRRRRGASGRRDNAEARGLDLFEAIKTDRADGVAAMRASRRTARLTTIFKEASSALQRRANRDNWDPETHKLAEQLMCYLVFGSEEPETTEDVIAQARPTALLSEKIIGTVRFYFTLTNLLRNKYNEPLAGEEKDWYRELANGAVAEYMRRKNLPIRGTLPALPPTATA